jgi:hypothetical protein
LQAGIQRIRSVEKLTKPGMKMPLEFVSLGFADSESFSAQYLNALKPADGDPPTAMSLI